VAVVVVVLTSLVQNSEIYTFMAAAVEQVEFFRVVLQLP
jgi:hypothetical protein